MMCLDNTLSSCCGYSLGAYIFNKPQTDEAARSQVRLPVLALTQDQGSTGFSVVFFAHLVLKMQLAPLLDPSHRCVRDIEPAFAQCGLAENVHLMKIALNTKYGPWDGAAFWRKRQEEVGNYTRGQHHTCPLFQHPWPAIAAAEGTSQTDKLDAAFQAEYFRGICDSPAFSQKGPRLQPAELYRRG